MAGSRDFFPNKNNIFQDNNAPAFRAHIVQEYKQTNSSPGMFWPAPSPDGNITENIWFLLKNNYFPVIPIYLSLHIVIRQTNLLSHH